MAGMAGGQMLDLEAEGRYGGNGATLDAAAIRRLQGMKTGALLGAAVRMGAIIGRADLDADRALAVYGEALGAAFQVADDILDVESSAETLGKATGKDAGRGKGTLVGALGLEAAKQERDRLAALAVDALAAFGEEADILRAAARFSADRQT
jgi:farnesyl diphosphate synthase